MGKRKGGKAGQAIWVRNSMQGGRAGRGRGSAEGVSRARACNGKSQGVALRAERMGRRRRRAKNRQA